MTDVQLYIDGKLIYTPPGFSLANENQSPQHDLDSIVTGGMAFDVQFPFGKNQITMQHAHRIDTVNPNPTYTAQVYSRGELRINGFFTLQTTQEDAAHQGFYRGSLTSNDILEKLNLPLPQIVSKEVKLGTSTAQIIAFAKSQNAADMSKNGITGSVMKFIPHYNPDFYAKSNPDWFPEVLDWYDPEKAYEMGEFVKFQESGDVRQPSLYQCITYNGAAAGEDPISTPLKWKRRSRGIINDWDIDNATFRQNEFEIIGPDFVWWFYPRLNTQMNYRTLVPFLQVMDVLRDLSANIGYSLKGDFVNDEGEHRMLMYSNFALDNRETMRCIVGMEYQEMTNVTSNYLKLDATVLDPPEDYDPHGLWDNANHYLVSPEGYLRFRIRGKIFIQSPVPTDRVTFEVKDGWNNDQENFTYFNPGDFNNGPVPFAVDVIFPHEYPSIVAQQSIYWHRDGRVDAYLEDVTIEIINMSLDGLNTFSGNVKYKNHMPDLTGVEFLLALRQLKNLHITFNPATAEITLDYAKRKLETTPDKPDDKYRIAGIPERTIKQRRRFELRYAHEPSANYNLDDFNILPPVDNISELPPADANITDLAIIPVSTRYAKAIFVRSEGRYYVTDDRERNAIVDDPASLYEDIPMVEWVPGPHDYEALQLNKDGALKTIQPALGPLPMMHIYDQDGNIITIPETEGVGQSASFLTKGKQPPFLITYWLGMDTSNDTAGYPLATTTGRNAAGTKLLFKTLDWETLFYDHWRLTLQSLVIEEVIKIYYAYYPHIHGKVNFENLLLINNTPALPIRTSEMIGGTNSGFQEIEARKVKMEGIKIVSDVSEIDENTPWTPINTESYLWYDISDGTTLTLSGGKIVEVKNKVENARHLLTVSGSANPDYTPSAINGLPAWNGNGTAQYKRATGCAILEASFYYVVQFSAASYIQDGGPTGRLGVRHQSNLALVDDAAATYSAGAISLLGEPHIVRVHFVNNASRVYLNGTQLGGTIAPFGRTNLITELTIGAWRGGSVNFNGLFGEMVCIQNVPLENISQRIEGYLAHKWGLSGKLPSDHPYKSDPPTI